MTNLLDSGPGSLRAAITAANATAGVDLINFTPGLHGTIKLASGEPAITAANLTINGPGENQLTVSGNNAYRVFDISNSATVKIDNLTIADGLTVGGNGGGILNEAGADPEPRPRRRDQQQRLRRLPGQLRQRRRHRE